MQKVVFIKSISKQYINLQNKIKKNHRLMDGMKLLTTVLIFLFTLGAYGYFVNISSTKGYFLRQEMRDLEEAKFNYSIVQLDIMKIEKDIWDNIQDNTKITPVNDRYFSVEDKTIYVQIKEDIALN